MFWNANFHTTSQDELSAEKLWHSGDTIKNHPRVRLAQLGEQLATVHRLNDAIPSGIRTLIEYPELAAAAGFRFNDENFYVMDFVEGEMLDTFPPDSQLIQPLLQQMLLLWRFRAEGLPEAKRERPIIGPITPVQYVNMPDTVLSSAYIYSKTVSNALQRLATRDTELAIVHGDLKADNIVRVNSDSIRFIDWECSGAGHPEDDIASLLASLCVYGLGRAVQKALDPTNDLSLDKHVTQEIDAVRSFSNALLQQLHQKAPEISTDFIGEAFLVSCLCRLQGILFVPSSEAMRLTTTEFVTRTMQGGSELIRTWLTGDATAEVEETL